MAFRRSSYSAYEDDTKQLFFEETNVGTPKILLIWIPVVAKITNYVYNLLILSTLL
jgi:hypothetical protein